MHTELSSAVYSDDRIAMNKFHKPSCINSFSRITVHQICAGFHISLAKHSEGSVLAASVI